MPPIFLDKKGYKIAIKRELKITNTFARFNLKIFLSGGIWSRFYRFYFRKIWECRFITVLLIVEYFDFFKKIFLIPILLGRISEAILAVISSRRNEKIEIWYFSNNCRQRSTRRGIELWELQKQNLKLKTEKFFMKTKYSTIKRIVIINEEIFPQLSQRYKECLAKVKSRKV